MWQPDVSGRLSHVEIRIDDDQVGNLLCGAYLLQRNFQAQNTAETSAQKIVLSLRLNLFDVANIERCQFLER
jgi:hypothetical protein